MITGMNFLLGFLMSTSIASGVPVSTPTTLVAATTSSSIVHNASLPMDASTTVPDVPFYSQFRNIQAAGWQKLGCGVASLAMIIDFYSPRAVSVNALLQEGIAEGAYSKGAGWKHEGLVLLAREYGLKGEDYDLSHLEIAAAFAQFEKFLKEGPVMASVYYKFDPKSPIPHLVVINGIEGGRIYYNDPAGIAGGQEISIADFMKGWKRKFIVIQPQEEARLAKQIFG